MWKKVVAPTVIVVLLWITVSSLTTFYINWLYESQSRVLDQNLSIIQTASGMQSVLWRLQAVVAVADELSKEDILPQVTELKAEFALHLDKAQEEASTPQEQALIHDIRGRFATYCGYVDRRLDPEMASHTKTAFSANRSMVLSGEVAEACKGLLSENELRLREFTTQAMRLGSAVSWTRFAFLIIGPLVGIGFGLWVARGLHRSVSQISVTLSDVTGVLKHEVGHVALHPSGDLPALEKQVQEVAGQIKRILDQLQQARHEAMRSERLAAVGELAAGVAHELRNPLTSVKLLIQSAAQRQPQRPLEGKYFEVVQDEIDRMERTIQGLLDFARPPQLRQVRHDLRQTLQRALNLVEGRAQQRKAIIREELPDHPVMIFGDPEQLHQVFVNLLINGIEAMDHGGTMCVAVEPGVPAARRCRVVFRDSGKGIPTPVLQRLFEPFVTTKERGTGLGLAVSQRIMEQHGGTLTAANQQEGGAAFTVELPLAAEPPATADPAAALESNHAETAGH